jgi:putative membrane protein
MGWGWHDSMMFGGGFMWLVWLLLIAGVAWLVATLVASRGRRGDSTGTSATDIVKERYARGEIDRTEYEQKLQDLRR